MTKTIDDPGFASATSTPLVSDAAVTSVVRLGYCALAAAVGGGLAAWGMWLAPAHAADILGGLGLLAAGGGFLWLVYRITES